jgi:hypothetical protein
MKHACVRGLQLSLVIRSARVRPCSDVIHGARVRRWQQRGTGRKLVVARGAVSELHHLDMDSSVVSGRFECC